MNQILVTKKVYVTPELKRKKSFYKIHFLISILLIATLAITYLYAEFDRNRSEAVSKELLSEMNRGDSTTVSDDILVAYLDGNPEQNPEQNSEPNRQSEVQQNGNGNNQNRNHVVTASDGSTYSTVATITIPSLDLSYPVLSETSDKLLKVSPCKFWGPNPNEVGNFCVVGHNYRNTKFFSKVPDLAIGDTIKLTDMSGKTLTYKIYDKYTVDPTDVRCTSQLTNGKKEVTLITCTDDSQQRVVIKTTQI